MKEKYEQSGAEEEMTVSLNIDGEDITCSIVTVFDGPNGKEYIALLPLDENGENNDGEVWIYGYKENPKDPNEEPELIYIEDEEEYELASDAFDEFLDNVEFDEML